MTTHHIPGLTFLARIATFASMTDSDTYLNGAKLPIGDVARIFGVSIGTIRNWERDGRITAERTLGGQRRFTAEEIKRVRDEQTRSVA